MSEVQIVKQINQLYAKLGELRKNRLWKCPCCKVRTRVRSLVLTNYMAYDIEDWRSTGLYGVLCPKCNKESTEYKDGTSSWAFMLKNPEAFKCVMNKSKGNW